MNLPKASKMAPAGYQTLTNAGIPVVELANGAGSARVIAGQSQGARGPARTSTPVNLWDLRLRGGSTVDLTVPEGDTTALFVLKGHVTVNGTESARDAELVTFERRGDELRIEAKTDATVLLLNGEPIEVRSQGRLVAYNQDVRAGAVSPAQWRVTGAAARVDAFHRGGIRAGCR